MQSEIAKKLYEAFDRTLKEEYPYFTPDATRSKKGMRVYHWRLSDGMSIFLALVLSPNSDAFTGEAAWSRKHTFPFHLYPMSPLGNPNADIPPAEPIDGEFRFRIPELWDAGKDSWWHIRGDSDKRDMSLEDFMKNDWATYSPPVYSDEQIQSVADSVVSRIGSEVLPFVKSIIER